jgi:hypothetical protein
MPGGNEMSDQLTQEERDMDFYTVLDQVLALLRQRGRVSYRALKRQFQQLDAHARFMSIDPERLGGVPCFEGNINVCS